MLSGSEITRERSGARESALGTERTARLMQAATYAAVAVALCLIGIKLAAWLVTDSVSLLSSLVDSVMDVLASSINLLAVRHALTPADREHRFGHTKIEPLASLGQAAFIGGSGMFIVIEAIQRLIRPEPVEGGEIGIGVMVISMALTLGLVLFQRFVVRRSRSTAIRADAMHYASDVFVNGGVILAFVLALAFGWHRADPVIALAISGFILWAAVSIAREALDHLMDRELPDGDRARIRQIALSNPRVIDCHDMRTRAAGVRAFIQLHLELPRALSLIEAHQVCDDVEMAIRAAFPNADVIIHPDPEGVAEPRQTIAAS
jgi:ferrous-iron efflux pump FieF